MLCIWVLSLHICLYHMLVWCPQRQKRLLESLGLEFIFEHIKCRERVGHLQRCPTNYEFNIEHATTDGETNVSEQQHPSDTLRPLRVLPGDRCDQLLHSADSFLPHVSIPH